MVGCLAPQKKTADEERLRLGMVKENSAEGIAGMMEAGFMPC